MAVRWSHIWLRMPGERFRSMCGLERDTDPTTEPGDHPCRQCADAGFEEGLAIGAAAERRLVLSLLDRLLGASSNASGASALQDAYNRVERGEHEKGGG